MLHYKEVRIDYLLSLLIYVFIGLTSFAGGYKILYPLAILSLILHFRYLKYIRYNKMFLYTCIFIAISFIYLLFGLGFYSEFRNYAWLFFFLILTSIYAFLLPYVKCNYISIMYKAIIICVIVSLLSSILISYYNPSAIRHLGFGNTNTLYEETMSSLYQKMGMVSYILAHAFAVLPPFFCIALFETHGIKKIGYICLFCMSIYLSFIAIITTALISSLIASIMVVFYYLLKRGNAFIPFFVVGFILYLLIDHSLIIYIINAILPYADNTLASKLNDISMSLSGGSGDQIEQREQLYITSFDYFIKNPLFGGALSSDIGQHNLLLDYLAAYGVIGFLPLFLSFIFSITRTIRYFPVKYKVLFIICLFPVVMLSCTKSSIFIGGYFMMSSVIIPICFIHLYGQHKQLLVSYKL